MPNKEAGPDQVSAAYTSMVPKWTLVSTILAGRDALRAAGTKLLPQHDMETDVAYQERLLRARHVPWTKRTLESLVGTPFSDPMRPVGTIDGKLAEWLTDIDTEGSNLGTFCRDWFKEGLAKGMAHVLVDMTGSDLDAQTMADEADMRPFWKLIPPEAVIAVQQDGNFLTQVRIQEKVVDYVGWEEVEIDQIRVLTPEEYQLWRKKDAKSNEWVLHRSEPHDFGMIPMVTFYTEQTGNYTADPPLLDLAHLNTDYWQSSSDQVSSLTYARFPMFSATGVDPKTFKIAVGPTAAFVSDNERARFGYVEHNGTALGRGEADLQKLEEQMAMFGAQFLVKKPTNQTATARMLDTSESTSNLKDMVERFNSSLEEVFKLTHMIGDTGSDAKALVAEKYGPEGLSESALRSLEAARNRRDISHQTFMEELQRHGVLSDEFDYEQEQDRLEAEGQDMLGTIDVSLDE